MFVCLFVSIPTFPMFLRLVCSPAQEGNCGQQTNTFGNVRHPHPLLRSLLRPPPLPGTKCRPKFKRCFAAQPQRNVHRRRRWCRRRRCRHRRWPRAAAEGSSDGDGWTNSCQRNIRRINFDRCDDGDDNDNDDVDDGSSHSDILELLAVLFCSSRGSSFVSKTDSASSKALQVLDLSFQNLASQTSTWGFLFYYLRSTFPSVQLEASFRRRWVHQKCHRNNLIEKLTYRIFRCRKKSVSVSLLFRFCRWGRRSFGDSDHNGGKKSILKFLSETHPVKQKATKTWCWQGCTPTKTFFCQWMLPRSD